MLPRRWIPGRMCLGFSICPERPWRPWRLSLEHLDFDTLTSVYESKYKQLWSFFQQRNLDLNQKHVDSNYGDAREKFVARISFARCFGPIWNTLKYPRLYPVKLLCCSPCLELYNMKWLILELNILIKLSFLNAVGLLGEFLVNSTSIGDFPSWPISQCALPSQRLKTPNMPLLFFGKLWGCPTVRSWMKVVYKCL